jgi:hypothetical protein
VNAATRRALAWAFCAIALGLFLACVVVPAAKNPYTVGFITLYAESRILRERPRELARIYDDPWFQERIDAFFGRHIVEIAHAQPPTMSLMLGPLGWTSPHTARALWIGASTLLWLAGLALLASALRIRSMAGVPAVVGLAALGTIYGPLLANMERGQGYVLLFFLLCLLVWGLLRAEGRRAWRAGIPLGLALVLKSAGLWLCPLLLVARQWRVLLGAAAAALVVALCFTPIVGWQVWPTYVRDAQHFFATEPTNHVAAYQTVSSLAGHLFIREAPWNPSPLAHLPLLARSLTWLVAAGAFLISFRFQRLASDRLEDRALTLGMFIALITPMAPIGEAYHYMLILPAVVIAWWWAVCAPASWRSRILLAVFTLLLCAPQRYYDSPRLRDGGAALLAYPLVYGAFGLWGWLIQALRARRSTDGKSGGGETFHSQPCGHHARPTP